MALLSTRLMGFSSPVSPKRRAPAPSTTGKMGLAQLVDEVVRTLSARQRSRDG
jgi:hypothetical protein